MELTLFVNFLAGPNAGKSTTALWLAAQLKMLGIRAEYVREQMKDHCWEDTSASAIEDPVLLCARQANLIGVLQGKVRVAVVDSPVILGAAYSGCPIVRGMSYALHRRFQPSVNVWVQRGAPDEHDQTGRIHTAEESIALDSPIRELADIDYVFDRREPDAFERLLAYVRDAADV